MAKRDYYEVLGLARSASADEIKKAHRKLVRQYHPDVNPNNPDAAAKFQEVQEAYDVLSDPEKRKSYDQFGHAGVGAGGPGSAGDPWEAFRRAQQGRGGGSQRREWRAGPNVSVEDMDFGAGGAGGFADIFEQFFGARPGGGAGGAAGARGRGRPQPAAAAQRGQDVEHAVQISFADAARGTTLPLQINREGKLETIEVKIPAGVKEGSRIRIKGRGQQVPGGESGDLYILTRVSPHPYFKRDDLNILLEVPVSLYEAVAGTKVEVPTLDGPVTITVPAGTSSHTKLRIKGRGVHRGEEQGDQFCVIRVVVPKDLTDEEKSQLEAVSRQHPLNARQDVPW